jgi:hypothetical protein
MKPIVTFLAPLIIALGGLVLIACPGCVELDPQTKAQVHQIQQKQAVDAAKAKAAQAAKDAAAKANPTAHPLTANAQAVKKTRDWLLPIGGISLLVVGAFIGLSFTPLSFISKIGLPVAAGVCAVSWFGVLALPFFPWVGAGVGVCIVALFVYELARAHWKLPDALKAIENDIGFAKLRAGIAASDASKALTAAATAKAIANTAASKVEAAIAGTPSAPIVTISNGTT